MKLTIAVLGHSVGSPICDIPWVTAEGVTIIVVDVLPCHSFSTETGLVGNIERVGGRSHVERVEDGALDISGKLLAQDFLRKVGKNGVHVIVVLPVASEFGGLALKSHLFDLKLLRIVVRTYRWQLTKSKEESL